MQRSNISNKGKLVGNIKDMEKKMAKLSSDVQKSTPFPNLPKDPKQTQAMLSDLRQHNPLCFRAVQVTGSIVQGPDVQLVELSDEQYVKINKP